MQSSSTGYPVPQPASVPPGGEFAGFWRRFAALIIDTILQVIVYVVLSLLLSSTLGDVGTALAYVIFFIGSIVYYVALEAGPRQATPGKRAMGIMVVTGEGHRIGVGRAIGRYFAKIISGLTCYIGFIMAAFTARKQGLHDMIADTLVVVGKPQDS